MPALSRPLSFVERHAPALAGAAAFGVYAALAPTVCGDRKSSELTLALATCGVPHPTGYPLYVLGGHVFVTALRAMGASAPHAANLWSALGAAVAIGFLVSLARRLARPLAPSPRLGLAVTLLPAAVLLFHPLWAAAATVAEVHSWHLAWVLATLDASVILLAPSSLPRSVPRLSAYGFLLGLGLAHHATASLVLLPVSVVFVIAAREARLTPRHYVAAGLASHVPLLAYGWLAWRAGHPGAFQWPQLDGDPMSILMHISGASYGGFLGVFAPSAGQRRLLLRAVVPMLGLVVPALAALALWRSACPSRRMGWMLLACGLLPMANALLYGVDDPAAYFLPTLALGLAALAPLTVALADPARTARAGRLAPVGLALLTLVVALPGAREASLRRSYHEQFDRRVRALWNGMPADSAIVFWSNDGFWRLREYQILEGDRTNLYVNHPLNLTSDRPRYEFADRFGFDPAAGLDLDQKGTREASLRYWVSAITGNVAGTSPIPVFDFRPGDDRVDWIGGGVRDPRPTALSASGSPPPAASGGAPAR
jgi:hypothetical protein